jgi:entericidin B
MRHFAYIRTGITSTMLTVIVLAWSAMGLAACNTTAGVGQDVSATGHAVTNSAEKVKQGL